MSRPATKDDEAMVAFAVFVLLALGLPMAIGVELSLREAAAREAQRDADIRRDALFLRDRRETEQT